MPDRIVAQRVVRESDSLRLADRLEEGREHFWLVRLESSLTDAWLFPAIRRNQFAILDPAYPGQDIHLSPENTENIRPATAHRPLSVQGQQSQPWTIKDKGELIRK